MTDGFEVLEAWWQRTRTPTRTSMPTNSAPKALPTTATRSPSVEAPRSTYGESVDAPARHSAPTHRCQLHRCRRVCRNRNQRQHRRPTRLDVLLKFGKTDRGREEDACAILIFHNI
jgi:hypothetical protein